MTTISSLAGTARLIGDPTRAAMLVAMMDGRAFTAGELARAAGVTPPTASGHLAKMLEAGLLSLHRQGRNRYYRLSSSAVGTMLEGLMGVANGGGEGNATKQGRIATGPRDKELRRARTCYDHLAGEVAVRIAESMVAAAHVVVSDDGAAVTETGLQFLETLGVRLREDDSRRSAAQAATTFCRPCLDWSERKIHFAGAVGKGLYQAFVTRAWIRPVRGSRAVEITAIGIREINERFSNRS